MMLGKIIVAVPWLTSSGPDLHEAYAALEQAPGGENLPRLGAGSIEIENVLGLFARVERIRRVGLHAVSHFKRLDARLELRLMLALIHVALIERQKQIELAALFFGRGEIAVNVLNQLIDVGVLRVDVGTLVHAGQKA